MFCTSLGNNAVGHKLKVAGCGGVDGSSLVVLGVNISFKETKNQQKIIKQKIQITKMEKTATMRTHKKRLRDF